MYTKEIKVLVGLKNGYLQFRDWDHPLHYESDGSVYLHRHLASIKMNRWLTSEDHVHHIDENRLNNEFSNLEILTAVEHALLHNGCIGLFLCPVCGVEFEPHNSKSTHCSTECAHKSAIKNKEITKEILDALIPTTSWTDLGKMFGYTDNGIKKRAKALGCDITKSKYRHKK